MHIFEKLPQILGLCPIVKFLSTLEKSDPPKHFVDPSTEKSCKNYCWNLYRWNMNPCLIHSSLTLMPYINILHLFTRFGASSKSTSKLDFDTGHVIAKTVTNISLEQTTFHHCVHILCVHTDALLHTAKQMALWPIERIIYWELDQEQKVSEPCFLV